MFLLRRSADRVTVDEAHRRTHGPDAVAVLLDVREQVEWRAGHAPGAVHAPLSRLTAGAALPGAARARPLVVICRSGHRSRQAAALLAARGADAVDVTGGMRAWAAAGHPVVDERGNNGSTA
ncbi:rhodanese-like domain-containing protein [Streptomyces sp. 5-8]|uniref:Rhodanese-like domain-containing protein n=1 Tax=Streptomyces musisoli TaxID=2802280 RepID=A0ABS1NW92_9ACTN|nr:MULTISPECIES: rhodanese-like domain-containing protein [Streptomyces]MBL1104386.1 rhodanese-like domain-containing protein [Streptomyces musisoli]MBY8840359.1 rhodanese-like domain-containing protein [Streptomyces sp. SP2-10]